MEDRFKFRFFDKKKQKMMYENSDFSDYCKDEWWGYEEQMALEALDVFDNPELYILMQCTGLKDKNGKLIYEGDIISFNHKIEPHKFKEKMYKISFEECYFTMEREIGKNIREVIPINRYAIRNSELTYYNLEVIGNIYENKELLNEI